MRLAAVGIAAHAINHLLLTRIPLIGWQAGMIYHLPCALIFAGVCRCELGSAQLGSGKFR